MSASAPTAHRRRRRSAGRGRRSARRRGAAGSRRRRNRRVTFASPSVRGAGWREALRARRHAGCWCSARSLVVAGVVAASVLAGRAAGPARRSPRPASPCSEIRVAADPTCRADEIAGARRRGRSAIACWPSTPTAVAARWRPIPGSRRRASGASCRPRWPSRSTERRAVASALLGALYLIDESGRPFKRATFEEADGLPVITGVTREQYAALRAASEAVFREALALLPPTAVAPASRRARSCRRFTSIRGPASRWCCSTAPARFASAAGRRDEKLARLDRILAALAPAARRRSPRSTWTAPRPIASPSAWRTEGPREGLPDRRHGTQRRRRAQVRRRTSRGRSPFR